MSRFQWVNLQIEELIRCKTGGARRDRLATLPGDLKAAYDKIYDRIENLKDRAVLERCVKWVMCACRPLSSEELLAAAQLDQNGESLIVDSPVSEETLLSLCNNLLVIDSQREVWQFSHFSVAEYFIDKHWTLQQAHSHVARMSLLLLMRQNPEAKEADPSESSPRGSELTSLPPGILKERHPLSEYVLLNWFRHTRSLEMELQKSEQAKDDAVARLLKSFLGSPRESSPQYRAWVFRAHRWGFWVDKEHDYQIKSSKLEPKNTPLFAMCIFSFYALLSDWWSGADIDTSMINAEGENLLALAAGSGCVSICKSLIGRGMDPNALLKGPEYGNSLGAAIQLNEMETVRFLLEKAGADPHMSLPGIYGSCLAIAAVCGLVNLARILIHEAHVDVNLQLQGGSYGSALAAAAAYGRIEIVKLLIKAGADVNALLPSGQFGSALSAAAHWGRTKIVKFLIQEAGARVEVFNKSRYPMEFIENFGYLPHWWRRIESVKFLVEEVGVDLSVLRQLGLTEGGETVFG
jgi:ankyrin repeat protein